VKSFEVSTSVGKIASFSIEIISADADGTQGIVRANLGHTPGR
jgi:hypothetical protein